MSEDYANRDIASTGIFVPTEVLDSKGGIGLRDTLSGPILRPVPTLGENIDRLRKEAGFKTQAEFAERIGVNQSRISDWKRGRYKSIDLGNLLAVAKGLKLSVDVLLEGVDPTYEPFRSDPLRHRSETTMRVTKEGGHVSTPEQARRYQRENETLQRQNKHLRAVLLRAARELQSARTTPEPGQTAPTKPRQHRGG